MRILVIPDPELGLENVTLDIAYNEQAENILHLLSLQLTSIPPNRMHLTYNGKSLTLSLTLEQLHIEENSVLHLSERSGSRCCILL